MHLSKKKLFLSLTTFISINSIHISSFAQKDKFYISCYFNDIDESSQSQNPHLMWPSATFLGANENYYWAQNSDDRLASYTTLDGEIEDGFFVEQKLTLADVIKHCNSAIHNGTVLWPSSESYRLYDFKASRSNYDGSEYPIQFARDADEKSKINKVVIFGDSLSERGNLKRWLKIFPYYPYWFGRFSNGFIWSDYLTRNTHLPVLDFSYGGAKTEGTNDAYWKDIKDYITIEARDKVTGSSRDYINLYLDKYLTTNSYITRSSFISDPQNTLFILWVGSNDYGEKLGDPRITEKFFEHPDDIGGANQVETRTVKNIVEQVKLLNSKGALHFLILNLPDAGNSPMSIITSYKKYSDPALNVEEVSQKLSFIMEKHSEDLKKSLLDLQQTQGNKIDITYMDIKNDINALLNNQDVTDGSPFNYGLSSLNSPYKVPGSNNLYLQLPCYTGGYYQAGFTDSYEKTYKYADEHTCKTFDGKIESFSPFWDDVHPTSYVHCWLAYFFQLQMLKSGLIANTLPDEKSYKTYCQDKVTEKNLWN